LGLGRVFSPFFFCRGQGKVLSEGFPFAYGCSSFWGGGALPPRYLWPFSWAGRLAVCCRSHAGFSAVLFFLGARQSGFLPSPLVGAGGEFFQRFHTQCSRAWALLPPPFHPLPSFRELLLRFLSFHFSELPPALREIFPLFCARRRGKEREGKN